MTVYSEQEILEKTIEIMNRPAEHTCSWQELNDLAELFQVAKENTYEVAIQQLLWEKDLLCPALGYKCQYEGKEVEEVTQKWDYYLEKENNFTEPFSNKPFCHWDKEAVAYYKMRLGVAANSFAKARYAFAAMTLSSGSDRYSLAEESFINWVKTGEEYVRDSEAVGGYAIASLAYGLAFRIAFEFRQSRWAVAAVVSLSASINEAIEKDWKGRMLDLFTIFSKNLRSLARTEENKEQIEQIRLKLVSQLKDLIQKYETEGEIHLARCFIECLADIVDKDVSYSLMRRAAETHIQEGDRAPEGLIRYALYDLGLKAYKDLQDRFPNARDEVDTRIEEIKTLQMEQTEKIEWKSISIPVSIEEPVKKYIEELKNIEGEVLDKILEDRTCLIDLTTAREEAKKQKESAPLSFIIPHSIHNGQGSIREHRSDEAIMDYKARGNIALAIKFFEIEISCVMSEMRERIIEGGEISKLLSEPRMSDIRCALEVGLDAMMKSPPDHVVAAHMLTPYVEELIRRVIMANGADDRVIEWERQAGSGERTLLFRKIELGGLLGNAEVRALLGPQFSDSLKCFLVEQDQTNFRNLLLHGLIPSKDIKIEDVYFLTYAILKLINIVRKAPYFPPNHEMHSATE